MGKSKRYVVFLGVVVIATVLLMSYALATHNIAVFSPSGVIAAEQRKLMIFALSLSLVVILPVFTMLFMFAWKYRADNKKAKYQPDWANNRLAETIWWGVPLLLIIVLSVVTWRSSHSLDPARALESDKKPLTIQVVALQWKWLFIYPEQGVASVNEVAIPEKTPVKFVITADAPMNSFWIPKLGGQIYAMSGMSTTLNLMADEPGDYRGVSANLSGDGFAGMHFTAKALTDNNFATWVQAAHNATEMLDDKTYQKLAEPSHDNPVAYYWAVQQGMYDKILNKYEMHGGMGHNHMKAEAY